MGKFVLFSLNLIFLFAYNFFFGGEVEIKQKFPEQVAAGEKFTVEITITKGEREGFAKWQQDLPEGFSASALETAGATFSFKKNTVKLIWMALPDAEEFTVSYEVQTDASLNGSFDLDGKFSFIEENDRKDITADAKEISIGFGGPALANESSKETKEPIVEDDNSMAEEKEVSEEKSSQEELASTEEDAPISGSEIVQKVTSNDNIGIERRIEVKENGIYEVSLTIDKMNFQSFGKVEEYIPERYTASEMENDQGMFSFNNNVMKILWMALPPKSTLEVKYRLVSTTDELDSATVHGVFSYLNGEESVQLAMEGSRFPNTFSQSKVVASRTAEMKEDKEISQEPVAALIPAEEEKTVVEPKKEKQKKIEEEITSIPAPETGISYRVQIAAGKKEVGPDYFVKRHSIKEEIVTDYHNNWYKYMIGSFGVYKEARDKRNAVWAADNKINDAFVTAYNSGERISVQEALMITKQKWYK